MLTSLPFSCQSLSPSPYFDQSLFRYDEKVWFQPIISSPCLCSPSKLVSWIMARFWGEGYYFNLVTKHVCLDKHEGYFGPSVFWFLLNLRWMQLSSVNMFVSDLLLLPLTLILSKALFPLGKQLKGKAVGPDTKMTRVDCFNFRLWYFGACIFLFLEDS
jgi:hypothetical protein